MVASESTSLRTLLVGIDAACLPVLERVFRRGAAPTIESLLTRGVAGPLESQIPPWTASAWPSVYTGVNPGKHGVFGFLAFDGYDWDIVNSSHVRERTIWELLDHHGLSSVVVNAPVTHPPTPFDGALVPGYVAPEDPDCHPDGLLDDIRDELGDYQVYGPSYREVSGEENVEWYQRLTRMRGETFRYLCNRFDPEFGFLQFQQTDTVFHEYPGDVNKVQSVYEAADEQIRHTLEYCDPDTVIVTSDHGIGPYDGTEFRVNDFLQRSDYVETIADGEGMPSWAAIARNRDGDGDADDGSGGKSLVQFSIGVAARFGLTSQRIGRILDAVGLRDAVLERVSVDTVRAGKPRVDFESSTASMRSRVECGIRLNVEGRDPNGVVSPDDYDRVRRDVIDALESATTTEGDPIFDAVLPREEVFHGPYVEEAVDVLIVPTDFDHYLSAECLGDPVTDVGTEWNHKRDGIVAATGAGVDETVGVGDAQLFDVAPTVLASLGIPHSDRMDGDPLPFVSPAGEMTYPEASDRQHRSVETEVVEQQLSDLGYLE